MFKLDDIDKKGQPFQAPEGYFEDLPLKIQKRIEMRSASKVKWYATLPFKLAFSIATVLIIVLSITFFGKSQSAEDILAEIPEEELLAYIDEISLEEEEILTAFENTNIWSGFSNETTLDELNMEDESLDELMIDYDLTDEYL